VTLADQDSGPHRLEILEWKLIARTISQRPSLFVAQLKGHPPTPIGEHGEILGRLEVGKWGAGAQKQQYL